MTKEILIISNYYPPEKGAAANRIEQLALKLHQNNYLVSVVCLLPNYPKGDVFQEYKGRFSITEKIKNINIHRLWIYPSNSKNLAIRLLSVMSFSVSLMVFLLFKKTPQKVIVQSPPLLLSFISVFILFFKQKKIILNVSDLWPLAALELKALKKDSFSHKISLFLEQFIYKKASVILGQSNEIITHVQKFVTDKKCFLYQNFPDHQTTEINLQTNENEPIKIFYAGLLGIAQGVFELCEKIDLQDLNIELHVFGDGAEKLQIEKFITTSNKKIFFHGMLDRSVLLEKLNSFDVAIVPLKTRIYGSVPSKIFEYGSLGFPILYFGGGEGENIVIENNLGWVVEVTNYKQLNLTLNEISKMKKSEFILMKKNIFTVSNRKFNLDFQIENLIKKDVF